MAIQNTDNIIDTEHFKNTLFAKINEDMTDAAEPIIQEALKQAEREMRQALAARLISFIESNYSVEEMNNNIVITVRQATGSAGSPIL